MFNLSSDLQNIVSSHRRLHKIVITSPKYMHRINKGYMMKTLTNKSIIIQPQHQHHLYTDLELLLTLSTAPIV